METFTGSLVGGIFWPRPLHAFYLAIHVVFKQRIHVAGFVLRGAEVDGRQFRSGSHQTFFFKFANLFQLPGFPVVEQDAAVVEQQDVFSDLSGEATGVPEVQAFLRQFIDGVFVTAEKQATQAKKDRTTHEVVSFQRVIYNL